MPPTKTYPVAEVFGPTIQGEGIDQGIPSYFVRFGGCDFKCEWCDTPHAVLPHMVRHADRLTDDEIVKRLIALPDGPSWVIVTGGNPVLHELGPFTSELHRRGLRASVETQGTKFKQWLLDVDRLCVSPKPPSSGMNFNKKQFYDFLYPFTNRSDRRWIDGRLFVKVVIFDHRDYIWAKDLYRETTKVLGEIPFFFSAGNDAGKTVGNPGREDSRTEEQIRNDLMSRYRWLVNRVMVDPELSNVRVQAQMHVLTWGNRLGV